MTADIAPQVQQDSGGLTILVDLGDTLVDAAEPDLAANAAQFVAQSGNPGVIQVIGMVLAQLRAEADGPSLRQRPADQLVAQLLAEHAPDMDAATLYDHAWTLLGGAELTYLAPLPGAVDFLKQARESGAGVVALSNTALPLQLVERIMEHHGVAGYFDRILLSSEIGWKKPAPDAFAAATEGVHGRVIMVGDDFDADIAGARSAGLEAVWINAAASPADPSVVSVPEIGLAWERIRRLDGSVRYA